MVGDALSTAADVALDKLPDILWFLWSAVVIKGILVRLLARWLMKGAKEVWLRSERQATVYSHTLKHTLGQGHSEKWAGNCQDETCVFI